MMSASASSDGYFHQRTFGHRHQQQQQQQQQRAGKMSPRTRVRAATTAAACGPLAGAASASRRPSLLRASSQPQPSCHIAAPYATRKALDWANDQATAVYKEMENLLELKYRGDIQDYMYHMEARTMPAIELIDMQPELEWFMRRYLMDFIIEVHQTHALRAETLYLAVNILDRYVSKRIVFKKHYQLVGCAALWIAAKFEDAKDRVPTVAELAGACNHAYEESAFIQMEGHVLQTIGWVLGHPTAEAWLRLAAIGNGIEDMKIQHTARFLMETTLFHRFYVTCKPSDIAIACLLLARHLHGRSYDLAYQTEAVEEILHSIDYDLSHNMKDLSEVLLKKYAYAFYSKASRFVQLVYQDGYRFVAPRCTPARSALSASSSSLSPSSPASSILSASTSSSSVYSPMQSPCSSESSFDTSSGPATPNTPLSSFSFMDAEVASTKGDVEIAYRPVVMRHGEWSDDASMVAPR